MGMAPCASNLENRNCKTKIRKLSGQKSLKLKIQKWENAWNWGHIQPKCLDPNNVSFGSETINLWWQLWYTSLIQHICTTVVLMCVWVFISSSVFVASGADYFIVDWMTTNRLMQTHLPVEMGAAAYWLPARWQDYACCIYAAGLSVAGLQALALGFQGRCVCMYVPKLKSLHLNQKIEKLKTKKMKKM